MEDRYNDTVIAISEAGKKEFFTYGHEKALLGRIAKEASVVTGTMYSYFPGKRALLSVLTSGTAEELLDLYRKERRGFATLSPEQQPTRLNKITEQYIPWMVNYVYDHFGVFKLFLCCDAQKVRDRYFDGLAVVEEQSRRDFIRVMESLGHSAKGMSNTLIYIPCRPFFQQLHGFVSHDLPREQTITYVVTLGRFQHAD